MCYQPIKIKNPNYGKTPIGYNRLQDCTNEYIQVPCGNCGECIAIEQMEYVQRIQMEALKNWLFMGTLTYKNETLPKLVTSQGYEYRYADTRQFTAELKRLRKNNTYEFPFREIYVSERGGKGGRPHIHCLLLFKKEDIGNKYEDAATFAKEHEWDLFNEWKQVTKKGRYSESYLLSDYRESYRYGIKHKTYDFHFVDPRLTEGGVTDVAFYVLKYMLKGSDHEQKIRQALFLNYSEDEAKKYWNTIKSRKEASIGMGLNVWDGQSYDWEIIEYLREGIERSKNNKSAYPLYYTPERLLTFPLAKYYKNNGLLYNMADAMAFYHNVKRDTPDNQVIYDKSTDQMVKAFNDYERKLKIIDQDIVSEIIEELY